MAPTAAATTTTNYEVDKTVRVTRNATGNIRRLNAAVVVNNRKHDRREGQDDDGSPLTSEELDKLTALVRESIGFKQDRGDSVKVVNAPFKTEPNVPRGAEEPLWKQPR